MFERNLNPNYRGGRDLQCHVCNSLFWVIPSKLKKRKCVLCGSCINLEVDHIKPLSRYLHLALDKNNCRTLCKECHIKTDTYGIKICKIEILNGSIQSTRK